MKKFILNSILFLFFTILCTEIYIRINHLTVDIPRREIDKNGIQKYKPLQNGYWSYGSHKWQINKEGWPGELPSSFHNMITLIGDSHIENFMNPDSCHLGAILNKSNLKYNFFEAGRSGVTLIEAFEISKALKKQYKPTRQFIFAKNSDFKESIVELNKLGDVTQVSLAKNKIIQGQMKSPFLKMMLYNFKTLYYFRNSLDENKLAQISKKKGNDIKKNINSEYYEKLLVFIKNNYETKDIVVFLHPDTEESYRKLLEKHGFNCYQFKTKSKRNWGKNEKDQAHWSCYGFHEASKQIINFINKH
jgi:hypothetical protein